MATRYNLSPNPSAEVATTGYTARTRCSTPERVLRAGGAGSYWIRWRSTSTNATTNVLMNLPTVSRPGTTNTISIDFATDLAASSCYLRTTWYSDTGALISGQSSPFISVAAQSMQRMSNTVTVPANAATVETYIVADNKTANTDSWFYVDCHLIEPSSTANPYFDGTYPNAVWEGTPHASSSVLTIPDRLGRMFLGS